MADQEHNRANEGMPQLRRQGSATQLIVDGSPFLVIGGELRNSSSSSIDVHAADLAAHARSEH